MRRTTKSCVYLKKFGRITYFHEDRRCGTRFVSLQSDIINAGIIELREEDTLEIIPKVCKFYDPMMNSPGAWLTPLKVMPPMAYARFPKTAKRKFTELPKKMRPDGSTRAFKLADLLPARRSGSSDHDEFAKYEDRRPGTWPALMIKKSTQIFGQIPAENRFQMNEIFDTQVKPLGYFYEKSEIEISPLENILREKRYSVKTFFDHLSSGNDFSRGAPRFRREIDQGPASHDVEEIDGLDQAENASRLLAILAGNHGEEPSAMRNHGRRSKRQTREDEATEKIENREEEAEREGEKVVSGGSRRRGNERRKSQYTPVFKECNDTAASEISDLNAPPPPPERRATLQAYSRNGGQHPEDIDYQLKKSSPVTIDREKNENPLEREEVVEARPKETATSLRNSQNATYINLQDHQKGTQDGNVPKDLNGYPLDIAPYNPDVIPYVDVPDYSDQREESLDKDDRKVAKERYVEYPDDDADVIDPEVPLKSDKKSEKIIVRDEYVPDDAEEVPESPVESRPSGPQEARKYEEDKEEEVEEERGSFRRSNDSENAEEEKEHEETNSEDVRNSESASDDAKDFEPVDFDIEEYKKPFNLEELFKDIEKEAEQAQKKNKTIEKDVNEHQSSKNIPVREDSDEVVGDLSEKYYNEDDFKFPSSEAQTPKKRENGDFSDVKSSHEDANLAPPNFFEEFERVFGSAIEETPFQVGYFETEEKKEDPSPAESPAAGLAEDEHEKYPYGGADTYDRLFEDKDAEEDKDKAKDGDTFYKQLSDDDNPAFLHNEKQPPAETDAEEPTDELLREPYKTLATILDKKDDISRLDEEVAEKAKKEGKMPPKYHNYWTLEYGSPAKEEKT